MGTSQSERPRFYEQQYLGAADLDAAVDYERRARARHDLGAHIWGIAQGLELTERAAPSGDSAVDVYIQPGFAWDGFGRSIIVLSPFSIPPALFSSIAHEASDDGDPKGRLVRVWIGYVEAPLGGPAKGFQVCVTDDQYSRVWENFQLAIGDRAAHAQQHDPVDVAGHIVDAATVLRALGSPTDPLLADESVSYQTFPDDWGSAMWLVPLGSVRWFPGTGGAPGSFQPRKNDPAKSQYDLTTSERQRRYIGVVAETVNAAHGRIRMRDRADPYEPSVWSDDLVWVEGSLRVRGDARLFGGKLDFRDSVGQDNGVPLTIGRLEINGQGGTDLQVRLGATQVGHDRLVVGPDMGAGVVPAFLVQDDAKVGVGSAQPAKPLTVRAQGVNEELIGFEDPGGVLKWHVNQKFGGVSGLNFVESGVADGRLFIKAGGYVGVGTITPSNKLHVDGYSGIRQNKLHLSGGDGWSSIAYNAHHNDANNTWVIPDAARKAVTIEMDDAGGVPRFEVWSLATAGDATTWTQRLRINGDTGDAFVVHNGGRLGVGTTNPVGRLTINGIVQPQQGTLTIFSSDADFAYDGGSDGLFVFKDTGGKTAFLGGNIGIGTTNPGKTLEVAGAVRISGRLGTNGLDPDSGYPSGWGGGIHTWDLVADGSISSPHKYFLIEHPLDPQNKYLLHSTLEGPEMAVYYRGEARLSDGECTIVLPPYFEALTRRGSRTVLLTPKYEAEEPVSLLAASDVDGGRFTVRATGGKANPEQLFYWEVKAARADVAPLDAEPARTRSDEVPLTQPRAPGPTARAKSKGER